MKPKTTAADNLFKANRSYTPEEVIAAGGATAFGRKRGKNNETLIKALQDSPPIEPFSDEEWADLMAALANDK